ncbi:hypothetical protein BaRGS_00013678 [Batillaria attramentaria]|uniref:Uncharacterized protein n=1 Tax=Batillaria attramentaria TaxID=370345 RepID=A0ABD0L6E0_9CAEN
MVVCDKCAKGNFIYLGLVSFMRLRGEKPNTRGEKQQPEAPSLSALGSSPLYQRSGSRLAGLSPVYPAIGEDFPHRGFAGCQPPPQCLVLFLVPRIILRLGISKKFDHPISQCASRDADRVDGSGFPFNYVIAFDVACLTDHRVGTSEDGQNQDSYQCVEISMLSPVSPISAPRFLA